MKGLDTNVLIRFLVKDDEPQARRAAGFIRAECSPDRPCVVNRIVLCELEWVFASAYGYSRAVIAGVVEKLLRADALLVEDAEEAWLALRAYRGGRADLADCLIAAVNRRLGCETTATFDRKAASTAGFELLD